MEKSRIAVYILILGLTAGSLFVDGYGFGRSDHAELIPPLLKLNNPKLFERDLIFGGGFDTLTNRLISLFLLSGVAGLFGLELELVFFLAHVFVRFLVILLIFKICSLVSDSKIAPVLASILIISSRFMLNGFGYMGNILVPYYIVIPFVLLSLYFVLRESYFLSIVFATASVYIHFQLGLILSVLVFASLRFDRKKVGREQILKLVLLFLVLTSYISYSTLMIQTGGSFERGVTAYEALKLRFPHHALPSYFAVGNVLGFSGVFLSFLYLSFYFRKRYPEFEKFLVWGLSIGGMFVFGFVFTEIFPVNYHRLKPVA